MPNTSVVPRSTFNNLSAREAAVVSGLPLVKSITARLRRLHSLNTSFDELYTLGVEGLLQAADRFDPNRGVTFTTFAYYRVRGAILDSLRRAPEHRHLGASRAAATHPALSLQPANDNGRSTGAVKAAKLASWIFSEEAPVRFTSLDEIGSLADESAPGPEEDAERRGIAERVAAALSSLPETERRVVELHYYEELSFAEISARLGMCKPWAFRLHNKALERLRQKLAELGEADDATGNA